MPRKAFLADLQEINGSKYLHVSNVKKGEDDGEFTFDLWLPELHTIQLSALVQEVSDYPKEHTVMFIGNDDTPSWFAKYFDHLGKQALGKTVPQILDILEGFMTSVGSGSTLSHFEDEQEQSEDEIFDFDDQESVEDDSVPNLEVGPKRSPDELITLRRRLRQDLRIAKESGFKVGHYGLPLQGYPCFITISCRISKLGLTEGARTAWALDSTDYLVLTMYYPDGYKSLQDFEHSPMAGKKLQMHVGTCGNYKPTLYEVSKVFGHKVLQQETRHDKALRDCFISTPLNTKLNERLLTLINYRRLGLPWSGAERLFNHSYGKLADHTSDLLHEYGDEDMTTEHFAPMVAADHFRDPTPSSFPLIAMQWVLRHVVRCTEFCVVCFEKLDDNLGALKPYVCDKPLCLYQYMAIGLGPSIEHEVLSQPKVVDLLISFCYVGVKTMGHVCNHLPIGLNFAVPEPTHLFVDVVLKGPPFKEDSGFLVFYDRTRRELLFKEDSYTTCPAKAGDWIIITPFEGRKINHRAMHHPTVHCRVIDTACFPTVQLGEPVAAPVMLPHETPPAVAAGQGEGITGLARSRAFVYNRNFDDLETSEQCTVMWKLLDMMPSMEDMKSYLNENPGHSLADWKERMSPALYGILRWIIVSNRACIIQDDSSQAKEVSGTMKERVIGMPGWEQFHFVTGAPDKEKRFLREVELAVTRKKLKHPTLFAFHGSRLENWHSIIREGIHFGKQINGRAYGNGVYHSLDCSVSRGYTSGGTSGSYTWPQSCLKIHTAMALNEIVNSPSEFVSNSPHLVVSQLDWIQTRYLFVLQRDKEAMVFGDNELPESTVTYPLFQHDPLRTPRGDTHKPLQIPLSASPFCRRTLTRSSQGCFKGTKKLRLFRQPEASRAIEPREDNDDAASIITDDQDRALLFDDEDEPSIDTKLLDVTPYTVTTLSAKDLPMMALPTYASNTATRRLQKDLMTTLKLQAATTPHKQHELGWHLHSYLSEDNLYQWIVELHSFPLSLPLAQDMQRHHLSSVLLELRFGPSYPMSPPFIRVIRPRFLPFAAGGGGHVTAGGALCMELLTNDGWSAVNAIEAVLLQVRLALCSEEPRPARLDRNWQYEYGVGEAVEAFRRACQAHGWRVPADLIQVSSLMPST